MNEKFIDNNLNPIEKEKVLIDVTLSKTKNLNDFLDNIANSSYSVSLNDVILFEKIFSDYKKYNLFEDSKAQELFFNLSNTLKLLPDTKEASSHNFDFQELRQSKEKEYRLRSLHTRQSHSATCSIASYLMAANIYKNSIRPSKESEISLYNELREENAKNVELYNLIKKSVSDGFYTKVYSQLDYREKHFDSDDWELRRQKYIQTLDEYKTNNHFKENPNFNIEPVLFRERLQDGEAVLVNGTTGGGVLHMRLITGYKGNNFIVSDPLSNRKEEYTPELIELTCNPPAGKWCMSISNKDFDFYAM